MIKGEILRAFSRGIYFTFDNFKDEMLEFKKKMKDFKDEMSEFKIEVNEDRKRMNEQWG